MIIKSTKGDMAPLILPWNSIRSHTVRLELFSTPVALNNYGYSTCRKFKFLLASDLNPNPLRGLI